VASSGAGPLLIFDFDGVLVDGMPEYWWAARTAARRLLDLPFSPSEESEAIPEAFHRLRPLIHKGWEMVLAAAELSRHDLDLEAYLRGYGEHCRQSLERWGVNEADLQGALEAVRHEAIAVDRERWLARHRFFPGVPERLRRLEAEGASWGVLTTKGRDFAAALLAAEDLQPVCLDGHEQGSKPEVLERLLASQPQPLWFIEDRRATLEAVEAVAALAPVRCFLALWGYLGPGDAEKLPERIRVLDAQRFAQPLARWP
jgi:phosphoglycolate phosphatase-like HAD superfamily hydrolase